MREFVNDIKSLINLRSLKYGSNSVILIVAVVALAVVINMIFSMIPAKLDLTANKLYSITDETKTIIDELDTDIIIYGLFDEGTIQNDAGLKQIDELLQKYKSDRIKIEYVDADRDPTIIQKIDPDNLLSLKKTDYVVKGDKRMKKVEYGDLFVQSYDYYGHSSTVTGIDAEQKFTAAIKYVTSEFTPVVYFTQGHDERRVETELTYLKTQLERNNYDVKYLNLLTVDKLPEDAEVIIFAGPKKDINQAEREKLKEFLEEGLDIIFMFDSLSTNVQLPMFESILVDYNITLNYDRVMENESTRFVPGNPYVIMPYLQQGGLNTSLGDTTNVGIIMSGVRSLNILKNQKDYLTVTSLAKTSTKATGKSVAGGADLQGPLDLIVSAEYTGTAKPTRILAMGSSSHITDTIVNGYTPNGLNYFLMSLSWMLDEKDDVYIPAKTYEQRKIDLTQLQANVLAGITVGGIPLLSLAIGTIIWSRRRHL